MARKVIHGNPGDESLHAALATLADWLEYEAEVVEDAADDLDGDVAEAAHEQADAMAEAAEAVAEAAEEARETAAEVFAEGDGSAAVDQDGAEGEVVVGNPISPATIPARDDQEDAAHEMLQLLDLIERGEATREDWDRLDQVWSLIAETMGAGEWWQSVKVPQFNKVHRVLSHRDTAVIRGNPGEWVDPLQGSPAEQRQRLEARLDALEAERKAKQAKRAKGKPYEAAWLGKAERVKSGNPAGEKADLTGRLDALQADGKITDWYLYSPGDGSRRWVVWGPLIAEKGLATSMTSSATLSTAEVRALVGNPDLPEILDLDLDEVTVQDVAEVPVDVAVSAVEVADETAETVSEDVLPDRRRWLARLLWGGQR